MKVIDLSVKIENGMKVYPGDPEINVENIFSVDKDGWNMKRLHINSHDGTHVNVPYHVSDEGKGLDDYGVSNFFGEAILYENDDDIVEGNGILFVADIDMDVAKVVVSKKVKFVGFSQTIDEDIERYLLSHNVIVFENLVNTDKLPKRFMFYGVPLKIESGDGSPVRAFAVID